MFILFDTIVNGIVFLVPFWMVYCNLFSCCLYPATLLNSFISSNNWVFFVVVFLDSVYRIMSSANTDSFTSFLFECFLFIFLAWSFWLELPSTMLNRSGKNRHFCLVPDLRRKWFKKRNVFYMYSYIWVNVQNSTLCLKRNFFKDWNTAEWQL